MQQELSLAYQELRVATAAYAGIPSGPFADVNEDESLELRRRHDGADAAWERYQALLERS